jgi:hypothetical protein
MNWKWFKWFGNKKLDLRESGEGFLKLCADVTFQFPPYEENEFDPLDVALGHIVNAYNALKWKIDHEELNRDERITLEGISKVLVVAGASILDYKQYQNEEKPHPEIEKKEVG